MIVNNPQRVSKLGSSMCGPTNLREMVRTHNKIPRSTNLQEKVGWNLDRKIWNIRYGQGGRVLQVGELQVGLQTCDTSIADTSSVLSMSMNRDIRMKFDKRNSYQE
jgi:hypothetical protein